MLDSAEIFSGNALYEFLQILLRNPRNFYRKLEAHIEFEVGFEAVRFATSAVKAYSGSRYVGSIPTSVGENISSNKKFFIGPLFYVICSLM